MGIAIIATWQLKCKSAMYSSNCEAQSMATKRQRASTSSSDSYMADKKTANFSCYSHCRGSAVQRMSTIHH